MDIILLQANFKYLQNKMAAQDIDSVDDYYKIYSPQERQIIKDFNFDNEEDWQNDYFD